ncbi:MAG: putative protein [Candidatus Erwinia impunctatus]|nr:putative protein [Culicoides impunctatus]
MNTIFLPATTSTPQVTFDFASNRLALIVESYPENAAAFYRPLISALEEVITMRIITKSPPLLMHITLRYFNSSSTKMLFGMMSALHRGASAGLSVELHWYHDPEDDISAEFAEELKLDFPAIHFYLHAEAVS